MFKKLIFSGVLILLLHVNLSFGLSHPDGCPIGRSEEIVCAAVMCDFGLLKGESPSECDQVKIDLAVYLASLGFWDKPAKCYNRDQNCNKKGKAKKQVSAQSCQDSISGDMDSQCLRGVNIMNMDCTEKTAGEEQDACYRELAAKNNMCQENVDGVIQAVPCDESSGGVVTLHETRYTSLADQYADDHTVKLYPQGSFDTADFGRIAPPGSFYYWTRDTSGELVLIVFLKTVNYNHCLVMPATDMLKCLGGKDAMYNHEWPKECKTSDNFKECMQRHGLL
ncbi:MAG: hypothetical protein KKA05_10870 [Alphaproteobacteria bacterium]|nr:hypothetical protein [Alphaproteobacteria bacterium]